MTDKAMISLGTCRTCRGPAQFIDRDGATEVRHVDLSPAAFQDDVRDLLLALGLSDHARPVSAHNVVQDEIIPAIRRLRGEDR